MRAGAGKGAPSSPCLRALNAGGPPRDLLPLHFASYLYADAHTDVPPALWSLPSFLAHLYLSHARRSQEFCTPVARRQKIDAVTEEDLLLYVLLSSNLALGYSVIL